MMRPFSCAVCALNAFVELHDVDAVLAERRADRRRRIGLAARDLELDECENLLRHLRPLVELLVELLDLVEPELDRNLPLEDVHQNLELLLIGVDVDDLAVEVGERA